MLLSAPVLGVVGCATSRLDGNRFEVSYPWYATILAVGFGLALVVLGVLLVVGRLKPKGKPRVVGVMALLVGGSVAVGAATTLPYKRIVITPEVFRKQSGTFGQQRVDINLGEVSRIVLYLADRFPRDHPKHSASPKRTFIEFVSPAGASTHVRVSGLGWAPAVDHLIALADRLEIEVDDQRKDVPRIRINNPFD